MAEPINHEVIGPIEDPTHPIRRLDTVDLISEKKTGGIMLAIIAGGALGDDARTQTRLVEKIGGYLHYIGSPEFRAEFGEPSPERTTIVVKAHHGSAPVISVLLKRCAQWAKESRVSLVLETTAR